jgi:hypothetical protein
VPGVILAAALVLASPHHHGPEGATLVVTINPEARVSVARAGPLPPPRPCGEPIEVSLEVVNEAAMPARLAAVSATSDVDVGALPPLTGAAREHRTLRLRLQGPPPVDADLAFDVGPGTQDVGWRSATHLLLTCTR